jgi:hypothetical protein
MGCSLGRPRPMTIEPPFFSTKGSTDLWSHPVAMLLLLRKKRGEKAGHAQNILQNSATSGQATSGYVTHVTSGQKAAMDNQLKQANMMVSSIWGQLKWHLRRSDEELTEVTCPEVT